jgi:hypothetical protein
MLLLAQSYAQIGAINKLSGASPSQVASTFGSGFFLLLVRLNLGLILRETCRCVHHIFLLGFPTGLLCTANQAFFWRRCQGERGFLQGESLPIFYFIIVLLIFFTLFLLASFYQKYKKISSFIVVIFACLLLVLLEWVLLRTPSCMTLLAKTTMISSALLLCHLLLRQIFMRLNLLC